MEINTKTQTAWREDITMDKTGATQVEYHEMTADKLDSSSLESAGFDAAATKRLTRKIDWNLLPLLALLYLLSFLDRTNIGNAKLAGLEKSLNMKGLQYNIALAVFFPLYVAAEVPSNIMMKAWRPSRWIPLIMVTWGICTICLGLVTNYTTLLIVRCALGIAEGGLFPGVSYYITCWYKRHDCGFRLALFFSAATSAGAFGGLLARGISAMAGIGGKGGWAWIFIIEGLLTVIVAIVALWGLHDYPDTAKFLNAEEKHEVLRRLESDRSALADEFSMHLAAQALKDWKVYVHMLLNNGIYTSLYSISLFLPTIIKGLGYTNNSAQLHTVPVYLVACVCCITMGFVGDKRKERGIFVIAFIALSIIGLIMLRVSENPHVKYAGAFLAVAGVYTNVPQALAWNGNNLGGTTKRGVGMAMHIGFANLGGASSAFIFLPKDGPQYGQGHTILLGLQAMSISLAIIMTLFLRWENKRRDSIKLVSEYTQEEMMAERLKGDYASFFRYTV